MEAPISWIIGRMRGSFRSRWWSALVLFGAVTTAMPVWSTAEAAPPRTRPPRQPKPPKPPVKTEPPPEVKEENPTLQRSNRMELDARLVRGEAARSGAVYLFQRAPRRLPPLVDLHQSYLDEIVVPVLGDEPSAPQTGAQAP